MRALADVKMLDVFLNYACQAKCPFCYNPPLTPELIAWKLPIEKMTAELLKGREAGFRGATFSGGEVTLLKDLAKMLRVARKAGYEEIGIITNGLLMADAGYFKSLVDAGLSFCCVSIHGAEAAMHDRMVRLPGSFEKVLKTLDHLEAAGVPTVLNFVLTRENASQAGAFLRRFSARSGVAEFQLYYPHYDGLMREHEDGLKLSMSEAMRAVEAAFAEAGPLAGKAYVYNMPPCLAPGRAALMRNWAREEDSLLLDPAAAGGAEISQERRDRIKAAACADCRYNDECLGIERRYGELFGDAELKAVPR